MNWPALYLRYSVSLVLYVAFVMVFPYLQAFAIHASLLAVVAVALASSARLWAGLFLSVVNIPVTLLLASRFEPQPHGITLYYTLAMHYMIPFVSVILVGILVGLLMKAWEQTREVEKRLARAVVERDYFHGQIAESVAICLDHFSDVLTVACGSQGDAAQADAIGAVIRHAGALGVLFPSLHERTPPGAVDLRSYIPKLVGELVEEGKAAWECDLEPLEVAPRTAVAVGIVLTELTANAVAYGMKDGSTPSFKIELDVEEELIRLNFKDGGPGYQDRSVAFPPAAQQGTGLAIIRQVVSGLRGSVSFANEDGASCLIEFPATQDYSQNEIGGMPRS